MRRSQLLLAAAAILVALAGLPLLSRHWGCTLLAYLGWGPAAPALAWLHPGAWAPLVLALLAGIGYTLGATPSATVTIHDDDEHLFPALQAGAFGYVLKEQARELIAEQLNRMSQGEPPLSPSIARRVIAYFAAQARPQAKDTIPHVQLTDRENEVLLRVAKGFTLPEIGVQLNLSRHTIADYVKQIYRKLNVSSRAEAALEAQRLGLFGRSR